MNSNSSAMYQAVREVKAITNTLMGHRVSDVATEYPVAIERLTTAHTLVEPIKAQTSGVQRAINNIARKLQGAVNDAHVDGETLLNELAALVQDMEYTAIGLAEENVLE